MGGVPGACGLGRLERDRAGQRRPLSHASPLRQLVRATFGHGRVGVEGAAHVGEIGEQAGGGDPARPGRGYEVPQWQRPELGPPEPAVGVHVAAGAAGVVGVHAVGDVEHAALERAQQRRSMSGSRLSTASTSAAASLRGVGTRSPPSLPGLTVALQRRRGPVAGRWAGLPPRTSCVSLRPGDAHSV